MLKKLLIRVIFLGIVAYFNCDAGKTQHFVPQVVPISQAILYQGHLM